MWYNFHSVTDHSEQGTCQWHMASCCLGNWHANGAFAIEKYKYTVVNFSWYIEQDEFQIFSMLKSFYK